MTARWPGSVEKFTKPAVKLFDLIGQHNCHCAKLCLIVISEILITVLLRYTAWSRTVLLRCWSVDSSKWGFSISSLGSSHLFSRYPSHISISDKRTHVVSLATIKYQMPIISKQTPLWRIKLVAVQCASSMSHARVMHSAKANVYIIPDLCKSPRACCIDSDL